MTPAERLAKRERRLEAVKSYPPSWRTYRRARSEGVSELRALAMGHMARFEDCWESRTTLANDLGMSVSTVARATRDSRRIGTFDVTPGMPGETPPGADEPRKLRFAHRRPIGRDIADDDEWRAERVRRGWTPQGMPRRVRRGQRRRAEQAITVPTARVESSPRPREPATALGEVLGALDTAQRRPPADERRSTPVLDRDELERRRTNALEALARFEAGEPRAGPS